MCLWTRALLTLMVHARTSSGPAVKKYSSCKAAYPVLMILVRILKQIKKTFAFNSQCEKLQGKNYDITTEIYHDQNMIEFRASV